MKSFLQQACIGIICSIAKIHLTDIITVVVSTKLPFGLDISNAKTLMVEIAFLRLIKFAAEADVNVEDNATVMKNI